MLFCIIRKEKIIKNFKKEDIVVGRKRSSYSPIHFRTIPAFFNATVIKFNTPRPRNGRLILKTRRLSSNPVKLKSKI